MRNKQARWRGWGRGGGARDRKEGGGMVAAKKMQESFGGR